MIRGCVIAICSATFPFLATCGVAERTPAQETGTPTETDPVLKSLDAKVASFLEGVSGGQAQSALNDLLIGSQLLKQQEALKDLTARINELEEKYGKYRGFEQIAGKRIGQDLVLMRYLYKCAEFPVVWRVTFYRPPGGTAADTGTWRVVAVRFDTNLEKLGE